MKIPSCNGANNGNLTFEVNNFDTTAGFEYSLDAGTNWIAATSSPITTANVLGDGNYTVLVRKANDTSCSVNFNVTLTEPTVLQATLAETVPFSCNNTGATLEASATGGSPAYQYQLENTSGTIITPFQNTTTFTNVGAGTYLVRVQDANSCTTLSSTSVTVTAPEALVFTTTPTPCYSGNNDGSILVTVTQGNGNYEFSLNGGPWLTPSPATATNYNFSGLDEGNYTIDVRDQLGCPDTPNTQNVVIYPNLLVDVDITPLSACNDGQITINANGGAGSYVYAVVPANTDPSGLYNTTNTITITEAMATANPAGFDIYVQDNNGSPAQCTFIQEDVIFTPVSALSVTATPTNPECFDGLGSINALVSGGSAPFTYTLVDLSPADGIDYSRNNASISTTNFDFLGIGAGNYEVTITDDFGCTTVANVTINNATEITADVLPLLPAACNDPDPLEYGFRFDSVTSPAGTVEYSADGGASWQASNELRGYLSGTEVFPSIRVTLASGTICQRDFDRYIIPFPLDDLDITIFPQVLNCNQLEVTVRGSNGDGTIGYRYTYTDDPASFASSTPVWTNRIPDGTSFTFANIDPTTPMLPGLPLLIPGRTYVFYVEDGAGCVRESSVNVNDLPAVNLPIEIDTNITPTCAGATTGILEFTLTPDTTYPNMRWELFEVGNTTPIETSGGIVPFNATITSSIPLGEGDYYIEVIQVDGANADQCRGASENAFLPELNPISATAVATRDISCNLPGLISIQGITGGGGNPYTYDLSGPIGFTTITGTTDNPVEVPVNSPAGAYTVTLYDQYNCPFILNPVNLNLAPNPTLSVSVDNCQNPITVNATGNSAVGNLRYAMVASGGSVTTFEDNNGTFTNVTPGTYDVYVQDGNGCIALSAGVVVEPVLSASASVTKLLDCTATPDAELQIDITDGSTNYEYSISNTAGAPAVAQTAVPATNFTYNAPLAGDYTITIYDTNTPNSANCNREFTITVPARIEPIIDTNIQISNVSCFGANDGSFTINTTSNNAAPYSFEITSVDGTPISIAPTNSTATSATFSGLAPTATTAGYVVTVTGDAATNNCSVTSSAIIITEPSTITVPSPTVVPFSCTNTLASITVNDVAPFIQGGSGNFIRYEFIEEDDPNTAAIETPIVVQDGGNTTYFESNPDGGVYTINVYDDQGCVGTTTATINAFDQIIDITITVDDPIDCSYTGEDITLFVQGNTTDNLSSPTTYQYRLLPGFVYQLDDTFTNLPVGTHAIGVRNVVTGCETTVYHTVTDPNTFEIEVDKLSDVVCFGGDGSVQFSIDDPTYTNGFDWSIYNTNGTPADRTDDGLAILNGTNGTSGPTGPIAVPAGNFIVEITQTASPACSKIASFTITTPSAPITLDPVVTTEAGCTNDQGTALIIPQEVKHLISSP